MQQDICIQYGTAISESHNGRPTILTLEYTGGRGRPRYHIDRDWLAWAYTRRPISGIAQFLGLSRRTVRDAVLDYGLAEPQSSPFLFLDDEASGDADAEALAADLQPDTRDPLLDPISVSATDPELPPLSHPEPQQNTTSYTGPLSTINDDDLDDLIIRLRTHYRRAGITMLDGMLRRLGHPVPRERIRQSLLRVDPVHRVFDRIRIRRRTYNVPGPNALWHHDGQHGACLVCFFVVPGFFFLTDPINQVSFGGKLSFMASSTATPASLPHSKQATTIARKRSIICFLPHV